MEEFRLAGLSLELMTGHGHSVVATLGINSIIKEVGCRLSRLVEVIVLERKFKVLFFFLL